MAATTRPTKKQLELRRTKPPASRKQLRKKVEATVVRWQWATGDIYSFEPFASEMGETPTGKLLAKKPARLVDCEQYGFDAHGRMAVNRVYNDDGMDSESLIVWTKDRAQKYLYGDEAAPLVYAELGFKNDRIVWAASNGLGENFSFASYHHKGDRLDRVVAHNEDAAGDVYRFEWQGNQLARVVRHIARSKRREVTYRATPPSFTKAFKVLAARLPPAIVEVVARAKTRRRAFCLLLAYSADSPYEMSLPKLVLGLDKERRQRGAEDPERLFNPAAFELFDSDRLEFTDASLVAASVDAAHALKTRAQYTQLRKLYVTIAKRLNALDWSAHTPVTDDFIVLPVDDELADLYANAKATLPARSRKAHGLR